MSNSTLYLELNPASIIDLFSFVIALLLAVLFVSRKSENQKANVFLALAMLSLALEVFDVLSQSIYPLELRFVQTSLFTITFLFFYIYQSTNHLITKSHYLLFLPGIILNSFLLFLNNEVECILVEYVFNIALLVFIWKKLQKHREQLQHYYSDLENKTLMWMKLIVIVFLGFHALWIIEDIVGFQNDSIVDYFAFLSSILTFFMIFWIGHFGFSQQESFKKKLFVNVEKDGVEKEKENKIASKDDEAFINVSKEIIEKKYFVNPKLTLRILADHLHISEKELSRIINQQADINFYQMINQLRVNEFKKMMNSPKANKLSIMGLAQEAGFNSKSTFYAAFKSIEGMTPKQYEIMQKKSD